MVNETGKKSTGEELYLVHLKRLGESSDDEDDRDHPPRKRSCSIGEELYSIHLKRSKCFNSENETVLVAECTSNDSSDDEGNDSPSHVTKANNTPPSGRCLRNRTVPILQ